jgi:CubicO group peptidase (beta-lactamase class C family)
MKRFGWLFLFCTMVAMAQTPKIAGDYAGTLGPLHVKLHLKAGPNGTTEGTLDSVDQGATGLSCANFKIDGNALSFDVPSVGGKWHGTISDDGGTLTGSWSQSQEIPLVFRRDEPFVPAEKPSPVDGIWLGTLSASGASLRVQVQVNSDRAGNKLSCSLDSLDQGAMGLGCENVQLSGNRFSFEVPAVKGNWVGTLAQDGNQLDGTWTQGKGMPLRLTRQQSAVLKAPEPPTSEDAMAPVPASDLKAVLDRDLAAALKDGALAPATGGGVVIGVVQHGARKIFAYGAVKEDSIFEIGSVSKTFTALMLAEMVEQHKVALDQPVRELLPPGTVTKPEGAEITLLDLARQHSGLPRLPDNLKAASLQDPYAAYHPANLYEYLSKHGVAKPADPQFNYSNLGVGLLGQALANRAGTTYPELLQELVTTPLKLTDTVIKLTPGQEKRFAQGHNLQHQPVGPWNFDALAGAGAIRSTAADLLTYLEAQLHPDRAPATLAGALAMCHELHGDVGPKMKIGLAWIFDTGTGSYWHNGGTGGYSSYALFNPKEDYAVVVLFNATVTLNGSFADSVGQHIAQRLTGKPAVVLHD